MKQDWPTKRLADVCQILGGATPSKKNPKFYGGDIPWATVGDMNVEVITTTEEYITKAAVADCSTNVIPSGSIVMATRVGLGKVCVLGQDTAINQDLKGLTPNNTKELTTRWLFWWLKSIASDIQKAGTGATVQGVKMTFVQELEIPLPPLAEQKRIVALLDEAFAGIDEAKAKATASQHDAEELISEYVRSTFSDAGIEWRETTLGEAFDVRDGTHDSPKYHTTGHPLVTSKNLKREGLSFEDVKLISRLDFAKINERSAVSKGDVLFAMIGTIGNPTLVEVEPDFAIKNVALFKNRNGQSGAFLKHYLNSSMVVRKMMKEAKGTTQRFVGLGYLRSFPIKLPPIETQLRVVRELNDIEDESQKLTRLYGLKYAKLDDLKQSFLSQAFAGELTA